MPLRRGAHPSGTWQVAKKRPQGFFWYNLLYHFSRVRMVSDILFLTIERSVISMAHYEKYKSAGVWHLIEHDMREHTQGRENIDKSLSCNNYNLEIHQEGEKEFFRSKIEQAKKSGARITDETIHLVSCVITLPKNFFENAEKEKGRKLTDEEKDKLQREFFQSAKEFLDKYHGKENCVSAWVHVDEPNAQPHMHYKTVPIREKEKKYKDGHTKTVFSLDCKNILNRSYLQKFHQNLQQHLEMDLGFNVEMMNGATENGNKTIQEMKNEKQQKVIAEQAKTINEQENTIQDNEETIQEQAEEIENNEQLIQEKAEELSENIEYFRQDLNTIKQKIEREANKLYDVGKRVEEYPETKLKKGHRIVPDDELHTMIEKGWFSRNGIKDMIQETFDLVARMPFIHRIVAKNKDLQQENYRLRQQVLDLQKQNKEQSKILELAENLHDKSGRSILDHLKERLQKTFHKNRDDDFER